MDSKSQLEELFDKCLSRDYQIAIVNAISEAYARTRDHCGLPQFGKPEAHDLRAHYLRATFEYKWRIITEDYPELVADSNPNSQNSYHHTWVRAGKIYLTASSVSRPSSKPRRAEFREAYAWNGQLSLFEDRSSQSEKVYAILLYGPSSAIAPSFITIGFPNKECQQYVQTIDLLTRYPGMISTHVQDIEIQEPMPEIRLSPAEIQEPQLPALRSRPKTAKEEESS